LIDLASRRNLAILAITHRDLRPTAALSHAARSLLAAARVAHHLAPDSAAADSARRIFLPIKNNLAPTASTLAFSLAGNRLSWTPDPVPADRINDKPPPSERHLAAAWIADQLQSGPLPAT